LTDIEYNILDELYFVTPYLELKEETQLEDEELKNGLSTLIHRGLVKVYRSIDEELASEQANLAQEYQSYFYLATKKGLFEHNQR